MGKDKMKKAQQTYKDGFKDIMATKREMERQIRVMASQCTHRNGKGKLKLEPVGGSKFRCKICDSTIDLGEISNADLAKAQEILHNALQQIRVFAHPGTDDKMINELGTLDFNIQETEELYRRLKSTFGRDPYQGKKKNKNNNDSFGQYGGNISFIGGGRNR